MPNDEYAELIAFLGRKFDAIDERFTAMDQRFDVIEEKLTEHDGRFQEVLGHLEHIYGRLERLEQEYQAILEGVRRIERLLNDERVKREELERGVELLRRQVAALQGRVEALEQQLHR